LWRWAICGLRGVRLETAMIGGVRVTSASALRAFVEALSTQDAPRSRPQMVPTRREEEIDGELDRIGL
jgi:hypothetical protein